MANRAKTTSIALGLAVFVVIFVGVAVMLSSHFLGNASSQANQGCSRHSKDHRAVIQNDKVSPEHITAPKCDTLTIVNLDDEERLIAFGPHDAHVPYNGIAERFLEKGQSFTVTLAQTGNFRFHDHEHDEVQGTFTVTN